MSIFDLFDLGLSPYLHIVLAAVAVALAYPIAKSIGDPAVKYRRSRCPLWIALPFGLIVATSPIGLSIPGVERVFGLVATVLGVVWPLLQVGLLIWQGVLSIQAMRARDEWPSTTAPFVVLLGVWILPVALADAAMIAGPMVK